MNPTDLFDTPAFPRASRYHPDWILAGVSGGAHPLWMAEWPASALDLRPGMRVLDLGCGLQSAFRSCFLQHSLGTIGSNPLIFGGKVDGTDSAKDVRGR